MNRYERVLNKIGYYINSGKLIDVSLSKEFINSYLEHYKIKADIYYYPNYEGKISVDPYDVVESCTDITYLRKFNFYFSFDKIEEFFISDKLNNAFANLLKLFYLLHELGHVEQFYFMNNNTPLYNEQINAELNKSSFLHDYIRDNNMTQIYDDNHNCFLNEYYANIRSMVKLDKMCKKYFYIDDIVLNEFNFYMANLIVDSYSDGNNRTYPLLNNKAIYEYIMDNYNFSYSEINIIDVIKSYDTSKLSDLDKLIMGFPISTDYFMKFKNVADRKIYVKSLFD